MKMVSKFALAAALSVGAVAMTAAPAAAQRSKKEEADPQKALLAQISPEFRKPAAAAEAALKAKDWATAETQVAASEAIAKNDAERYFAATMRLSIEANKKSDDGLLKVIAVLLANPNTPAASMQSLNYNYGEILFRLKRRPEAVPYLLKARELGGTQSDIPLMLAQTYIDGGKLADGVAEMGKAIAAEKAAGRKAPQDWYRFIFARLYNGADRPGLVNWSIGWLTDYPTAENWRFVLVNYRNLGERSTGGSLTKQQRVEVFRLMRGAHALADQADYFDYGKYTYESGLPWEAIAVFDEGRANGKLPAGQVETATLYSQAQTAVKSEGSLDAQAKSAATAPTGKQAAATADAYVASGNYAAAIPLYDLAMQKGSVDADLVNLHRGYALLNLGRKDEARDALSKVSGAPLSDVAHFWTLWLSNPTPPAS